MRGKYKRGSNFYCWFFFFEGTNLANLKMGEHKSNTKTKQKKSKISKARSSPRDEENKGHRKRLKNAQR
jgi:hypothetical protein